MNAKLKILLVEDNHLDAEMFSNLVRRSIDFTCEIDVKTSLHEAVCSLQQLPVDLVVLDLNLPDSKGLDTFQHIHEMVDIPVVIHSGAGEDAMTREAVAAGAQDYIIKGEVDTYSLTRALQFAVERSKRQITERSLAKRKKELELLQQLQETLLPTVPGYRFRNARASSAAYPAERASGDYCEIIPFDEAKFLCVVADVCGHGLMASQFMLSVRATIRAIARYTSQPAEILLATDGLLFKDFRHGRFVTMMIALVDTVAGTVKHASAGHQGHLIRVGGEVFTLAAQCTPIGVARFDPVTTQQQVIHLSPGDILFLATDGLIETQNAQKQLFGEERLLSELRQTRDLSPQETIYRLITCVREFRGESLQQDDITMVCVKYNPENDADISRGEQ